MTGGFCLLLLDIFGNFKTDEEGIADAREKMKRLLYTSWDKESGTYSDPPLADSAYECYLQYTLDTKNGKSLVGRPLIKNFFIRYVIKSEGQREITDKEIRDAFRRFKHNGDPDYVKAIQEICKANGVEY